LAGAAAVITILTTPQQRNAVADFQGQCPDHARPRLVPASYEALPTPQDVGGVVIFADLERLGADRRAGLVAYHDALVRSGRKVLNHPTSSLVRLPLLQKLHAQGLNAHTAHALDGDRSAWRFPVFLRLSDDHLGAETPLLHSAAEVDRAIGDLRNRSMDLRRVIAVEFVETKSRDGFYRTYGVYRIARAYFLAHVVFGPEWHSKTDGFINDRLLDEECRAIQDTHLKPEIETAFELANIEYGRMDFAIAGDRVCVWEINTNPYLLERHPAEMRATEAGAIYLRNMRAALSALVRPQ
jgi:hypothetical protein